MNIGLLQNEMRKQALLANQTSAGTRVGIISGYDPGSFSAKVRIQPEDVETGWLPILSPWVGNGWGFFAPPTNGDQVQVEFQEGGYEAGMVCLRLFSDGERPLSVTSGEFWLVHKSGSCLKFHNDGTVELTANTTLTYTAQQHHFVGPVQMDSTLNVNQAITGEGGMAISGGTGAAMSVTGDMNSTGTITGQTDVVGGGKSVKGHEHTSASAGSPTSPPI